MDIAGLPRSVSIAATVALFVGAGGCSPVQFPLLPQERTVKSGRETADAAGSAAADRASSENGRALYESNIDREPGPPPDTGTSAPGEQKSSTARSADAGNSLSASTERNLVVVERDGDTYQFAPGDSGETDDPTGATGRRLLRAVTDALPAREPAKTDGGAPSKSIELRRLVVGETEFELHGTAHSRDALKTYAARVAAASAVESFEYSEETNEDGGSPIEFHLTGAYSNE